MARVHGCAAEVGHHLAAQLRRPRAQQHRRGYGLGRLRVRLRRRRAARHLLPAGTLGDHGQRQPRARPDRPALERALPQQGRLPVRGRHGEGRRRGQGVRLRLLGRRLRRRRRPRPAGADVPGPRALPERGQGDVHGRDREGRPGRHALVAERRLARLRPRRRSRPVRHELPRVRRREVPLVLRGGRLPRAAELQRRLLHALPQQRRRQLRRRDEGRRCAQRGRARDERRGGGPQQRWLDGHLRRQRLDGELLLREQGRRHVRRPRARARHRARPERPGRLVDGPRGGGPGCRRQPRDHDPRHGLRQPALEEGRRTGRTWSTAGAWP